MTPQDTYTALHDTDTLDRETRHQAGRQMYAAYHKGAKAQRMVFARWCRQFGQQEARKLLMAWRLNVL